MILDKAAQKGTGKWTSQVAMDCGVPIPTIDVAVSMRQISAQKETRLLIAKKYGSLPPVEAGQQKADGNEVESVPVEESKAARAAQDAETIVSEHHKTHIGGDFKMVERAPDGYHAGSRINENLKTECVEDFERFLKELEHTLLSSFIVTYAQGMSLLQIASIEKNFELNLSDIAKIWRGGCIIRSALLEDMRRAFEDTDLPNLILDDKFAQILSKNREAWRSINAKFTESRVPSACLSSALAYFDAFRSERLPANLIQAQRDFFGAHTYQRTDKEGIFHTPDWNK
jgi:6-phosphogluconate dehydrogenase